MEGTGDGRPVSKKTGRRARLSALAEAEGVYGNPSLGASQSLNCQPRINLGTEVKRKTSSSSYHVSSFAKATRNPRVVEHKGVLSGINQQLGTTC